MHAFGVVAGDNEKGGGDFGANTSRSEQRRVDPGAELRDHLVEFGNLVAEGLIAAGQVPQGELDCLGGIVGVAGSEPGTDSGQVRGGKWFETGAEFIGRGQDQVPDLQSGLGAGFHRGAASYP